MTAPDRDFADIGREVLQLVGQVRRGLDSPEPRAELVDAGLGFLASLLEPLERCRDEVSGDVVALQRRADEWQRVGDRLDDALTELRSVAAGSDWTGPAASRFTTRMSGFDGSVGGAVEACRHLSGLLRTSADLMSGARGLVEDIIDRVVDHMIATEAAAEAASVVTAGASEAVALSSILAAVSEQVEQAIAVVERVEGLLDRIGVALRSVAAAFVAVDDALLRVVTATPHGSRVIDRRTGESA